MQMSSVSLITPSYHADLRRCELLCESIDRYVTGHDTHFIVVGDEDLKVFKRFAGPGRVVVPSSDLLPPLMPLPKWRGRRYFWSPKIRLPIFGWHLQQLRKIAMTLHHTSGRVICVDSDSFFFRETDVRELAAGTKSPLFVAKGDVNETRPSHVVWWRNAHEVLGLQCPQLPGDDYIGQLVVWDRQSLVAMTEKIEAACHTPWWVALARKRHFSEYITYGTAVVNDPDLMARHELTTQSACFAYWDGPALDRDGLTKLISNLEPHHHALAIQSHIETPLDLIREVGFARA